MYYSWQNVKKYQQYYCKNNKEFIEKLKNIPLTSYDSNIIEKKEKIINEDLIESTSQEKELTELYLQNKLVSSRMGNVESAFLLKLLNINIPSHLYREDNFDYNMKANAGFYYKDKNRKNELWNWWMNETKELLETETITSCYCFLNFDLILWSAFNLKKKYYDYFRLTQIILKNSEGKKILYIGNAVDSIWAGYKIGLQNMWKFPVSNFSLYTVKTPQTTLYCHYPHDSIKETCEEIIKEIDNSYNDFDTAILGCGAYGNPLINMLRKKYTNKNIIYLGSDCYKMFGIYSKMMPYTYQYSAKTENWIEVVEKQPPGTENHPEPKYWKINNSSIFTETNFPYEKYKEYFRIHFKNNTLGVLTNKELWINYNTHDTLNEKINNFIQSG